MWRVKESWVLLLSFFVLVNLQICGWYTFYFFFIADVNLGFDFFFLDGVNLSFDPKISRSLVLMVMDGVTVDLWKTWTCRTG